MASDTTTARLAGLLPGVVLCGAITLASIGLQGAEEAALDHPYVEALVLAILLGTLIRTLWTPGPRWRAGIAVSAKVLLELAVMMLGVSISLALIVAAGPGLIGGIAGTVAVVIAASFAIGRALGIPPRMATLIACGNAICGNSAIAAVAPVIGARSDEVASAIAFTAVLGVVVVLGLPLLIPLLGLSENQYGVVAGLTVYAVPQVLAATVPVGPLAIQVGTLVKLVRVLMLGPVVIGAALVAPRFGGSPVGGPGDAPAKRPGIGQLVPWFIVGFLVLAGLRSFSLIPDVVIGPVTAVARILTIVSMAALGLGVDVRVLAHVGPAVVLCVTVSLALLVAISLGLVRLLGLA